MLLSLLVYYIFLLNLSHGLVSDPDLEGLICQSEFSFSYNYRRFHRVSDITSNRTDGFRLDFKVRADSNAHIILTETSFPSAREPAYEIVLGANRNTYSDIRRGRASSSKVKTNTPGIVSSTETRGFWIHAHNDGRILFGKDGEDIPILMWRDPSPLRIRYIAFCTWKDVYGKWYFNCRKKEEEDKHDDAVTSERPLTMTEKIRNDIFETYDSSAAPQPSNLTESPRTVVHTHLATGHVTLDVKKSLLDIYGTMSMSWTDEKLRWSPEDYGNKTSIVVQAWEIWVPDLLLYNAAKFPDWDALYGLKDVGAIVNHQGTVFWAPKTHLSAFCENINLKKWPKDTQTCELRLGFWSQQHLLQLELWENVSYLEKERVETEWEVTDVSAETVWVRTPLASAEIGLGMDIPLLEVGSDLVDPVATDESGELEIVVHSAMALKISMVRRNTSYNTILLIPLAMILIFTLLSFWATPFGQVKLGLQCLTLITVTLFLLITWNTLPAHADYVPSIVSAYKNAMIMTCISIVTTVIIINFTKYPPMENLPPLITVILTSEWISTLFFLPSSGEQVNKKYNTLGGSQQLSESSIKREDTSTNECEAQWNWILLSTVIDRTLFFIYTILFFYTFSAFV